MVLKLYNNNNKIQRNLSEILGYYLSSYLKEVDLKDDDFLFFNDFVEKFPLKREKYILMILINCLSKIKFKNFDKIYDVFNALNNNRKNSKFKEYTFENNKFYDLNAGIGEGSKNKKFNTDIIENNKLCSLSQKEKTINQFLISPKSFNSFIYEKDIIFFEPNMNEIFDDNNNYSIDIQNKNNDFKFINDSIFSEIKINNKFSDKINSPSQNELNFDFVYNSDCFNTAKKTNQINFKEILKQITIDFIDCLGIDEKINYSLLNSQDADLLKPLNGYNLLAYYEMKKNTKLGFYFGLELVKTNHNNFYLKTTKDFDENILLFEIGAEITSKEIFEKKRKKLEIKKNWYFYLSEGIKDYDSKIIFISDKGNIAYFIKSGKQNESNISIIPFIKPNKQICFLGITSKKIKKSEIIISNKILNI